MLDESAAIALRQRVREAGLGTEVLSGVAALEQVVTLPEVDAVMAAIVGAAGLRPTLAAAHAGKKILLANKETLVMAGNVFMDAVRASGSALLPIDSEHNAIFQALPRGYDGDLKANGVRRILLTASGGPFRNTPLSELHSVTPEQACAHPNWVMGRKISVDSASMMNKGLEVIEAHWLFNVSADDIQVVVHPQSVIHSLVEYVDGSVLAQLGNPDMRTPIVLWLGVSGTYRCRSRSAGSVQGCDDEFCRTRFRTLSMSGPGISGFARSRHGPGGIERRKRSGGGGIPRQADFLLVYSARHRGGTGCVACRNGRLSGRCSGRRCRSATCRTTTN